jgi:proteasome lid subunit RPN8/RPN11
MLGSLDGGTRVVSAAMALENVFPGPRTRRYQIHPEALIDLSRGARESGVELLGIYHSHPGASAHFSQTDLENSCPWYSFLVLSLREGEFESAACWRPNAAQSEAEREELIY